MVPRLLAVLFVALWLVPSAIAAPAAPQGVRAFLLRATEPAPLPRTFARTPSFAWQPVRGAARYTLELSTSKTFADNAVVWRGQTRSPVTTAPLRLPWMGSSAGYSWFVRVRATVNGVLGRWSTPYGFNIRASAPPSSLSSGANPQPGMIRWTPVDGATAYEVVFLYDLAAGKSKKIKSGTTAADLREYYTFHNDMTDPALGEVRWRVRAMRELEGTERAENMLPSVSYGAWSGTFTTLEPAMGAGPIDLGSAISRSRASDVVSSLPGGGPGGAHELVPGFWWNGSESLDGLGACPPDIALIGVTCPLFHVYVFTDADCVNRVHNSDLVGSPAYVPRLTRPLKLPKDPDKLGEAANAYLDDDATEGDVFDAGGELVLAAGLQEGAIPKGQEPEPGKIADRRTGIWDNDWPDSSYYWTAVPAVPYITPEETVEYHDVGFAEDMCQAGEVLPFGKTSAVIASKESGVPYVSGLTPAGRLGTATTSSPRFYGRPLVAWRPAPGAMRYEIQWSRSASPWVTSGKRVVASTSALLDLTPGVWYYRIRGLDETLPGTQTGMTWSDPEKFTILRPTFTVASRLALR